MPRIAGRLVFAVIVSVLSGLADRTVAGIVLVPGPYNGATQIRQLMPMGQTFTAVDPFVQSVGFSVRDLNPDAGPQDLNLDIALYANGLSTLLSSGSVSVTAGFDGFAELTLNPSAGPLMVGETYTAIISDTTSRWGVETSVGPDSYPGGAPVFAGVPDPNSADLALRVVSTGAQAVPLPSAVKMTAATAGVFILLAGWTKRRHSPWNSCSSYFLR